VKREPLHWLAANPHYARRFFPYAGKHCRSAPITDVADDLGLDWHAVEAMDKLHRND
jgi:hypothetical protein